MSFVRLLGHAGLVYAPVSLVVAGLLFGAITLVTVLESPQFSVSDPVPGGIALLLTTTWLCVLAAAAHLWWDSRPRRAAGLLGLAGLSWLVPQWDSPSAPAPLYAAALVLASVTPALVLHSALTWRDGRLNGVSARVMVAGGYVILFGLMGLAPALVFDPAALGCVDCPDNPWLIGPGDGSARWLEPLGDVMSVLWLAAAAALVVREVTAGTGRLRQAAIQLPGMAFLVILAAQRLAQLGWVLPHRSALAAAFWVAASLALLGVALGAMWQLLARRRARHALGRILLGLAGGQQPGMLRESLAQRLSDPTVELLYPTGDGTLVDALGRPFANAPTSERECTPLKYGGARLGLMRHSSASRISSDDLEEIVVAIHLGLEHEGLTARALAEERELRGSGMRLLAARDNERHRLERDLHDGAQQRLVGLALGLQLLARECPGPQLEAARKHLSLAIGELRDIAHGLSPPVLVDGGLVAALQALAETRDLEVNSRDLCRFSASVEASAYQLVDVATGDAPATVTLTTQDSWLRLWVSVAGALPDLTKATDRIVTVGGRLSVRLNDGNTEMEVDLPVTPALEPSPEPPFRLPSGTTLQ